MKFLKIGILFFLLFTTAAFSQKSITHKVVSGDSFYSIAKKYNVEEAEIYKLNPKVKGTVLQLNTVLKIPTKRLPTSSSKVTEHTVEANETFTSISKKYGISIQDLIEFNPNITPNKIKIGDVLSLKKIKKDYVNIANSTKSSPENDVFHKVAKGETLSKIAEKYNLGLSELKKLNPKVTSKIQIGQKILIQKAKKEEKIELIEAIPVNLLTNDIGNINNAESNLEDEIEEPDDSGEVFHFIEKGETLNSIARKYGIKLKQLKKLNPKQGDKLAIGHKLLVKKAVVNPENTKSLAVYAEVDDYIEDTPELSYEGLSKAEFLIAKASENIGTRYRSGGKSPGGFDCSGLMCYIYNELEFKLPRISSGQAQFGKKVKKAKAQKGDLIFFSTNGRGSVSHVGMVTEVDGDEIKFIHSSSSRGVIISSLNETYYSRRFVKINRVLDKF